MKQRRLRRIGKAIEDLVYRSIAAGYHKPIDIIADFAGLLTHLTRRSGQKCLNIMARALQRPHKIVDSAFSLACPGYWATYDKDTHAPFPLIMRSRCKGYELVAVSPASRLG